jgi:hypothetical protein
MLRLRLLQVVIVLVSLLFTGALTTALDGQTHATPHRTSSLSKSHIASVAEIIAVKAQANSETASLQMQSSNVELAGQIGGTMGAVAVQGNSAYISVGPCLEILDITSPATPSVVGRTGVMSDIVQGVAVAGDYAYLADGSGGLHIINVSDPAAPTEVGLHDTPGNAYSVAVAGDYAYVADGSSGLRIINASEPANPTEVGFYDTAGNAYSVAVAGDYVYVADGPDGLRIIDVSQPANPTEVGFYGAWGSVAVAGNYAYVADGSGLRIINVSSPANPTEVGFFDTLSGAVSVAVAGDCTILLMNTTIVHHRRV